MSRRGLQRERQLERSDEIEATHDALGVGRQLFRGNARRPDRAEYQGRARKQFAAVSRKEGERRRPDGDREVDRPSRIFLAKKSRHRVFLPRFGEAAESSRSTKISTPSGERRSSASRALYIP